MVEVNVKTGTGLKLTCERDELAAQLSVVSRAVSMRSTVQILSGILLDAAGDRLSLAATDMELSLQAALDASVDEPGKVVIPGRLLVELARLLPESEVSELEAIVPARALSELARIAHGEGELQLGVHENQVVFTIDGTVLTTRRIDGQFPNYSQLLPETFEHELRIPRDELLDVVRRVAVMSQRNAPLRLRFAEGELTISAQTQDLGEARESMPVSFAGEPLEIGFNPEFLREGIESVEGDELRLKLISPLRPGLIQAEGDDFWYLIMPIRLPD